MDKEKKKNLTNPKTNDIILTDNERRMFLNLRRIAKQNEFGTLTVVIEYHNASLVKGRVIDNEIKI